jgi:hypothetical protein
MKRQEAQVLAEILSKELEKPSDPQTLYHELSSDLAEQGPLFEFLSCKDRHHRQSFYLLAEKRWFQLYGWTMAKVLMLFGLLALVLFLLIQPGPEAVQYFIYFVFGASAYYFLLYIFSLNRYSKNKKRLEQMQETYRQEIQAILGELVEKNELPRRFLHPGP